MATLVGTEKVVDHQTISATSDADSSELFRPKRACRVINETGASVSFTIYEENPITKSRVHCEDIAQITVSAGSSQDLGALVFACERIALKLTSGSAELYVVAAE